MLAKKFIVRLSAWHHLDTETKRSQGWLCNNMACGFQDLSKGHDIGLVAEISRIDKRGPPRIVWIDPDRATAGRLQQRTHKFHGVRVSCGLEVCKNFTDWRR